MTSAFQSTTQRKSAANVGSAGTLGPGSYTFAGQWGDGVGHLVGVVDPARKNANFLSMSQQRVSVLNTGTEYWVAPGSYEEYKPKLRVDQFDDKRTSAFASTSDRFRKNIYDIDSPDSNWTLEKGFAEWTCNRGGGGCWPKAPRMSGTMAMMEKYLQDMAKMSTDDQAAEEAKAAEAAAGERTRTSKGAKATSEYAAVTRRPQTWPPLEMGFKELRDAEDLFTEEPSLTVDGRLPRRVAAAPTPAAAVEAAPAAADGADGAAAEDGGAPSGGGFQTLALRANNNLLTSIDALPSVLKRLLWDSRSLAILDLSFNQISRIPEAMSELPGLEMLRLHSNCLVTADDVRHLQPLKRLLRLTLMNNPLDATREYRLHMIAHLPTLKMFDNVVITQSERHKVEGFNRRFAKRGSPQH